MAMASHNTRANSPQPRCSASPSKAGSAMPQLMASTVLNGNCVKLASGFYGTESLHMTVDLQVQPGVLAHFNGRKAQALSLVSVM